jgi:hypothetical protein
LYRLNGWQVQEPSCWSRRSELMAISTAAVMTLGLYVVSLALAKRLRGQWKADGSAQSITRAGVIGGLEFISSVSGSALIALGMVWAVLLVFRSIPLTAALGGLKTAQALHALALAMQSWLGGAAFAASLVALYFMWVRPTGRAITEAYEAARRHELERLKASYEAGNWPEESPTPAMQELERAFSLITRELEALTKNPDPARQSYLNELLDRCRNDWFSLDVQRRMNPDYALASSIFERSGTDRLYSILAMLISRSTKAHVGRAQRLLARAVTVLLVLSLVGWASGAADASSAFLDLRTVQLSSSKDEAVKSLTSARTAAPSPPPSDTEIAELAQHFDHAFVRGLSEHFRASAARANDPGATTRVARLRARRDILDAATAADANRGVRVAAGVNLTKLESEALAHADGAFAGRHFIEDLRRSGLLDSGEFWSRIRSDRFAPIGLRDASETVISEIVGDVLRGQIPNPDGATEIQKLAVALERTTAKKAVMRAYTDAVNTFVTEVAHGVAPSDVLRTLSNAGSLRSTGVERVAAARAMADVPTSESLATKLAEREPALSHTEPMADDVLQDYVRRIRELPEARRAGGANAVRAIGSTYDDFFPRQLAQAADTSGTMVADALANALGQSTPRQISVPTRLSAAARSARMVRGLRFVGGVVIGDSPSDETTVDAVDLTWRRMDTGLLLAVTRSGRSQTLGSFDPRIVRQALTYAADGRTVAITMTSIGATARGLKVLAHPALVDTPLGNDIIEVDRLVDTHGRRDGTQPTDEEVLLSAQLLAATALCHEESADEARNELRQLEPRVGSLLHHLSDPSWSLFAARPQFFDDRVRTSIRSCSTKGLDACLVTPAVKPSCAERESWSGVREKPYSVATISSPFSPSDGDTRFQFLVQVVFVDPPINATADDDIYIDPDPWEYPASQRGITSRVIARMTPGQRAALRRTWQFTFLQRLFRGAIDGRLGPRAAGQLISLARDTAKDLDVESTPRWSRDPGPARLR